MLPSRLYNPVMIALLITFLYALCVFLLAVYTLGQALLLWRYWRARPDSAAPQPQTWPFVTIQLPLFNEIYVVPRLLDAVAALDYPRDRLDIQILDDSTDGTSALVEQLVQHWAARGLPMQHLRRSQRIGFKAGALQAGLERARGEFIAIFDADFVPAPDFLRRALPLLLADARVGLVQTRWAHLNSDLSLLTLAQALAVDAHFVVEQQARSAAGWLLPFNGSAGIWRAECIRNAGGWRADTLTEDLDLSYRAQLKGWRACYLPAVAVPAEVPPQLAAYKQQQARWAAGSLQNLLLHAWAVWRAPLPLLARLMGLHHLGQYLPHLLMLLLLLLTPPALLLDALPALPFAPLSLIGLVPPLLLFFGQRALYPDWRRRLRAFPMLVLVTTGLTGTTVPALLAVLRGQRLEFRRTPKFAIQWQRTRYALYSSQLAWPELVLGLYALVAAGLAARLEPVLLPYLLMYALAFLGIFAWELRDARLLRRQRSSASPAF